MTILIGSDPELFVFRGEEPFSAIGLLGGSKERPREVPFGAVQEDNVLAEFNINPAQDEDEFVRNLLAVRTTLDLLLPEGLYTKVVSSVEYPLDVLETFGAKAMEFGCDPDFDPYTLTQNETPNVRTGLRTAGGHIHIGYDNPETDRSLDIVQTMDVLLGIPSVLMDGDTRRRAQYGKAGAYRLKPYGVEYRVLSNFWLGSEDLMRWAYRTAIKAAQAEGVVDYEKETTLGLAWDEVRRIINESDLPAAEKVVAQLDLEVVHEAARA